ncbi:MAG: response regulator [Pseudomonadota bacterium]
MKILVIDDEKPTLSMFKLFLTAYGYEVFTAEDGEKGLAIFNEIAPEIVFTDIKMPGIDGLEVLKRIRQTGIPSQVIIITGHGDMEKAVEALDLDASDFINKPVERQALNAALSRAEKRLKLYFDIGFSVLKRLDKDQLILSTSGKLTATAKNTLMTAIALDGVVEESNKIKSVCLLTDDGFSIDRSGIALLIQLIQDLKQKNISVVLENISYNYARVFQMAGIDKLAQIHEALVED